jgi:hypothetical protein
VASAQNNGNGANNSSYSSTTNVAAPKIPVETAWAPPPTATVSCFKGFGVGVQTMPVGGSFGGGKIDQNCAALEAARQATNKLTFCKVYITNKFVRAAGVTLEDCMGPAPVVVPPVVVGSSVIEKDPVKVFAEEPTPIVTTKVTSHSIEIGTCKLYNGSLSNPCKRMLDDAVLRLQMNVDAKLIITGPQEASKAVSYLRNKIDPSRIGQPTFTDEANNTVTFELYWEN